ncbi:MAG TPA: hypothetical protein VGL61_19730 [Kofleriaceae bacterium]|jgi:hypothetical protein
MPRAAALAVEETAERIILVGVDPNGLAIGPSGELYVSDGRDGAIRRVDGDRARRVAAIDSGGVVSTNRISGLAVTPTRALYVARLGYGTAGAVFCVEPESAPEALDMLSPRFWRLGVCYDASCHAIYTTQFLKSWSGAFEGSVVRVELATGVATTVVEGLLKPVGVAIVGGGLVVTDARDRIVVRVDRDGSRRVLPCGGERPDSVCACDSSSVLVTTYDDHLHRGSVRRIWLDGRMRVIASGPWEPRGVACDGEVAYVAARRLGRVLVLPL